MVRPARTATRGGCGTCETGVIDRDVAFYMWDNGYDLRHHLQEHWSRLGPGLSSG